MSVVIEPYSLPDAALLHTRRGRGECLVFTPPQVVIVLGRGSDPARELHEEQIAADRVPVQRRATGGCAVVLSPAMLAVSLAVYESAQKRSSEYFRLFNAMLIGALERCGVTELQHAGSSDIARQDRKIAGTAIYRNRELLFYHAVINVSEDARLFERYLKLPPRMPAYREGRTHAEFVSSLVREGFSVDVPRFKSEVTQAFRNWLQLERTAPPHPATNGKLFP